MLPETFLFLDTPGSRLDAPEVSSSAAACNATIISSYYKIESKHSHQEYVAWMTNFLSLQDCIAVFVDPDQEFDIHELRTSGFPLITIPWKMDSFLVSSMVSEKEWGEQEELDPEQDIGHNRDLYKIWSEKTNMMKIVADQNPFASSYFVWMDIGAVRHSDYNDQLMVRNIPKENGVLLLLVQEFTEEEKVITGGKSAADFSDIEARI